MFDLRKVLHAHPGPMAWRNTADETCDCNADKNVASTLDTPDVAQVFKLVPCATDQVWRHLRNANEVDRTSLRVT